METSAADAVLIDLHYLPCIEYFARILKYKKVILEVSEHYSKQTYRNRCYVQIANKIQPLSVPIVKGTGKVKVKDVKISYRQNWQNNHWRTIASAYGNAPFFDFFADEIHDILYRKYRFLIDLNLDLLTKCLDLLQMEDKHISSTGKYVDTPDKQVVDYRDTVSPKKEKPKDEFFRAIPYNQIFGKDFVSNLSVIDLLFCEGSNANNIISRSISCES